MQFPKTEYMKLITCLDIKKRSPIVDEHTPYNDEKRDIYYSNAIDQFQKDGRCPWNWAAAFFPFYWLVYRGMFIYAFLYCLLIRLPTVFGLFCMLGYSQSFGYEGFVFLMLILWLICDPISFLILGKFGNRLYFHFLDNKINKGWNLVPKTNTHGFLVFSFLFGWLFLLLVPYYLYKKVVFNKELKKVKALAALNT